MRPDSAAVRAELDRLLASPVLANSRRLSRFLRYVVDAALAGESDRLKEYVIGVEVFDRGADYDPRVDSIVRVEASRLRAKLDEYYRHHGAADSVVISIERGGYAPEFALREPASAIREGQPAPFAAETACGQPASGVALPNSSTRTRNSAAQTLRARVTAIAAATGLVGVAAVAAVSAWRLEPSAGVTPVAVAVLPFTAYDANGADRELALRLSDGVTGELVRLGSIRVVASASSRALSADGRPRDVAAALAADRLVQGRVSRDGDSVRVDTALLDGAAETKLWFESFDAADLDELEQRIAAAVHAALRDSAQR